MPEIELNREHTLGLDSAREVTAMWSDQLRDKFGMDCRLESGETQDVLHFSRTGASGTLQVSGQSFALHVRLGFLLGVYKDKIEAEVGRNLDRLLAEKAGKTGKAAQLASVK